MENLPHTFLCYTRVDDEHYGDNIAALCNYLAREVQAQTGIVFPLFQVVNTIQWGKNHVIFREKVIKQATFFIAILTPSFFTSERCREDLRLFIERESELQRDDLIVPIHYIKCDILDHPEKLANDELAQTIATRKPFDLLDLHYQSIESTVAKKTLTAVAENIRATMYRVIPKRPTTEPTTSPKQEFVFSADGYPIASASEPALPRPAFNPEWLTYLDAPGGAVRLDSPFYIERDADVQAKKEILREGVTISVKGSRQVGKTSLLARLYQQARQYTYPVVYVDFQQLDNHILQDLNTLLRYLADLVARQLKVKQSPDHYWQKGIGSKGHLTNFLSYEVLVHTSTPVVLLMDEVDRILSFGNYHSDFFGLIRFWHNKRVFDSEWERFNVVLAYSTEAYFFISDVQQSPFNVGSSFELEDFDRSQVEELNRRHGSPIQTPNEMDTMIELVHGHPFLIRTALYYLTNHRLSVQELLSRACDDNGPFSEHLRRYLWRFNEHQALREAMKQVLDTRSCPTDELFYQLRSAGLVRGSSREHAVARCGLYAEYFGRHLL